jgi:hypothetical protein
MTTATSTSSTFPWNPDSLIVPMNDAMELVVDGIRLRVSGTQTVQSRLNELKLTEYYGASVEAYVEIQRPISSDYEPFVTGTIWLIVAGRAADTNAVFVTRTVLANISSDKYPTREEETRVRDAATALLESDTPIARWWNTLRASINLASDSQKETARTNLILSLVERAREDMKTAFSKNPRKGMSVKVVRGRKVPVGTEGKLFWVGMTQFGKRVGFKDASDTVYWTAWDNIAFTDPIDEQVVLAAAKKEYEVVFAKFFGPVRN